MIPVDKLMHAAAGLAVALFVWAVTGSISLGLVAAGLAGIGKEVFDYFHPETHTADPLDALATVAPALLLWLIVVGFYEPYAVELLL